MSVEAKQQKQLVIDEIRGKLDGAASAVLIDYMGITVAQADEMRKELREANVDYTIYKNTLMKRAVEGTEFEELAEAMQGPSALAISKDDATAPARILKKSIKSFDKMEFKAGVVEGTYYDKDGIEQIASIPSREELLAKFLGSIQSPVGTFVRTLAAIADAKPADGAEAPAEEAKEEAPKEEAKEEAPKEEAPAEEAKEEEPKEEAPAEATEKAPAEEKAEESKPEEPAE